MSFSMSSICGGCIPNRFGGGCGQRSGIWLAEGTRDRRIGGRSRPIQTPKTTIKPPNRPDSGPKTHRPEAAPRPECLAQDSHLLVDVLQARLQHVDLDLLLYVRVCVHMAMSVDWLVGSGSTGSDG